jgi:hypothetical protein
MLFSLHEMNKTRIKREDKILPVRTSMGIINFLFNF